MAIISPSWQSWFKNRHSREGGRFLAPLGMTEAPEGGMCAKGGEATIPFACVRARERAKPKEPTQEQGMHGAARGRQAGRQTTSIPLTPLRSAKGGDSHVIPAKAGIHRVGGEPPLFANAKGGRGERSETQGVHAQPRTKPPCIPPWASRGRDAETSRPSFPHHGNHGSTLPCGFPPSRE